MLGPQFIKASHSAGTGCVEGRAAGGRVQVRDSKLGEGSAVLDFSPGAWVAFLAAVKAVPPCT